ncbi:MAG: ABC transporter substrate-binding protein [Candidatus Dormibacterales bacterium]
MTRTAPAALGVLVLVLAACTPSGGTPPGQQFAADQTLSFPISQDLSNLDPALLANPGDIDILRNVFSGLYRFDDALREVPDLAVGQPAVSPDGLTYTFHIRHDAKFSNGDPITAGDVTYSWDRAATRQGDYAWLFGSVAGYADVAAGRAVHLSGLSKPDDYTVVVTLSKAAGDFIAQVGLWPYWVVDQKVIASAGQDAWFTTPQTFVGSGPFKLLSWVHGQSMEFAPVPGWYGGKTGSITKVHVDVQPDPAAQLALYESGVFSLLGYARQGLSSDAAKKYTADLVLKKQLTLDPLGVTYWVGFNLKTGPFSGDAGRDGRRAFSLAIDRAALADAVCNQKTGCAVASGGLISKGLQGYLGDGVDLNAKFDAAGAKALYAAWDPNGSNVKGLTYTYDTSVVNKLVCDNLAAQWKQNLGVTVACAELDRKTYLADRDGSCAYTLFRQSWSADYDHPRDWFDHLFAGGANSSGSCYANASFDQLIAAADSGSLAAGIPGYRTAGQMPSTTRPSLPCCTTFSRTSSSLI